MEHDRRRMEPEHGRGLAMQGSATDRTSSDFVSIHPLDPGDAAITAAMRAMVSSAKGVPRGIEARGQFDALMESVLPRDEVTFEADALGGIPGIWVHPANWRPDEAIVHLHGGWFNLGSARAYRHLVAHIAARAGARAFIPDYRLAPEHPFPAATDDVLACYRRLAGSGVRRIALSGDSAGGNLALGLSSLGRSGDSRRGPRRRPLVRGPSSIPVRSRRETWR